MSIEESSKNTMVALFHVGIDASTNIARCLRQFLAAVRYANISYGESHYVDFFKENQGHKFKDELNFIHVAYDVKKSDVERFPVTVKDRNIIEKYAHRLNIDYSLVRKPEDLDEIIQRKYKFKMPLTAMEEKLVRAFTFRDLNGNVIMDPENPKIPLINSAEYMLTIASTDLNKWELITRELERSSHVPTLTEKLKNAKYLLAFNKLLSKNKINNLPGVGNLEGEGIIETNEITESITELSNESIDKPEAVISKLMSYFIPKVKSYEELKRVFEQMGFTVDNGNYFEFTAGSVFKSENRKDNRTNFIPIIQPNPITSANNGETFTVPHLYKVYIPKSKSKTNDISWIYVPSDELKWINDGKNAKLKLSFDKEYVIETNGVSVMKKIDGDFMGRWEDKTTCLNITLPDSLDVTDATAIKMHGDIPLDRISITNAIATYERTSNSPWVDNFLAMDKDDVLQNMISNIYKDAGVISNVASFLKTPLRFLSTKESVSAILEYAVPRVNSYDSLMRTLNLLGFEVEENSEDLRIRTVYSDEFVSTSEIKGNDGRNFSVQNIQKRIISNERPVSVSAISNLLITQTDLDFEHAEDVNDFEIAKNVIFEESGIVQKVKNISTSRNQSESKKGRSKKINREQKEKGTPLTQKSERSK